MSKKQLKARKGLHFTDELHGKFYEAMHEAASADNARTRFGERISKLVHDARALGTRSEGRKTIRREIGRKARRHRHELNKREIRRLKAEFKIADIFSERCRCEYYRLTGRTAAESEGRSALEGLERWLGSWPLRPGRSYLKMLETAREKLTALLTRIDEELEKHAPIRSISEESNYRLGGKTMAGGR